MFFVGLVFLAICIGGPLYLLFGQAKVDREKMERSDSQPSVYLAVGALIAAPAAYAWAVVFVGFLLPSWRILSPNALTAKRVPIPNKRGPTHYLTLQDADMSFMVSAIMFFLLALGVYLMVRGVILYRRRSAAGR